MKQIPICWKCTHRMIEWDDDQRLAFTIKGCTQDRKIQSFEDAQDMCPLLGGDDSPQ